MFDKHVLRTGPAAPDEILPRLDLSCGVIHLQLPLLPLGLGSEPLARKSKKLRTFAESNARGEDRALES
jgi:hypothetical protein